MPAPWPMVSDHPDRGGRGGRADDLDRFGRIGAEHRGELDARSERPRRPVRQHRMTAEQPNIGQQATALDRHRQLQPVVGATQRDHLRPPQQALDRDAHHDALAVRVHLRWRSRIRLIATIGAIQVGQQTQSRPDPARSVSENRPRRILANLQLIVLRNDPDAPGSTGNVHGRQPLSRQRLEAQARAGAEGQYSSEVQQRRAAQRVRDHPPMATGAQMKLRDASARSSGRRGRRFKSCHPDQVGPSQRKMAAQRARCGPPPCYCCDRGGAVGSEVSALLSASVAGLPAPGAGSA